jgi:hypothetical protein
VRFPAARLGIRSLGLYDRGVGFNRVTWTPGHDRKPIGASQFRHLARLRREREAQVREAAAGHALTGSLMSLAALLGSEVKDPSGRSVGRLSDVLVHWTTREAYPTVRAGECRQ